MNSEKRSIHVSELSIRNPVATWMVMVAFILFGGIAFNRMGVSQLPDVDFPVVTISVDFDGAAPEVMELDVVDPIEEALTSVSGIKNISSSARTGSASISVEFDLDRNIDVSVQEVQSAIQRAMRDLPRDIKLPSIQKTNPEDQPIIWLGISTTSLTPPELMALVRDQIQTRFSTLPGVGSITLGGYREPVLRVWLSLEALREYQLTASDVVQAIQREHSELPAGRIETSERELNVRTMGEALSIEEFERIMINRRGGSPNFRPIPLKAVARVEEGTEDVRSLSRSQGVVSIGMGIRKQPGTNTVAVGESIKERMKEVATQLPDGVTIGIRSDTTKFIREAVDELNFTLLLSAILTALVCWLFLGSFSATINIIFAIPTSIIGSFIILNALGYTLNTFTLLGLSLAIGLVVDDSIMVLENIVRHMERGKPRGEAALIGAKQITLAATAATAAIMAIFLPVAFMQGIIGQYFLQFGVTLCVALAISLIEALTLAPMRCSQFLTFGPRRFAIGRMVDAAFLAAQRYYRRLIPWTLNHRWLTLSISLLFFLGTLGLGTLIKREFVPPQDQGRLILRIQTPVGSSLAHTDTRFQELERRLAKFDDIDTYFLSIGGFGGNQTNTGVIFLNLKPRSDRNRSAQELAMELRKEFRSLSDLKISIQDPSLSGFSARRGFPVEFTVTGPEWTQLIELTDTLMKQLEASGTVTDVDSNYVAGMPEIHVVPDRERAQRRGVELAAITEVIQTMIASTIAGKYTRGGTRYDIRVSLPHDQKETPEIIKKLFVRNNRGELVPLSELVTLTPRTSLQSISREDRQRAIKVYANVAPGHSQGEALATVTTLGKSLPPGYRALLSGSAQTFQESFAGLFFALFLGIAVSYMILASQFNSFIHPITILVALPFSVSGAFGALLMAGQTLNIYSMIGLILLMGIVKKNSILLVEFTNQIRETGVSVRQALEEACPVRLRPILMTSIATITGAVPAALALGPGAESRIPMAVAVIGGVLVSTVLTLLVVPCVYSLFSLSRESTVKAANK